MTKDGGLQSRHFAYDFSFVLRMSSELLEQRRICPALWWRPLVRHPVVDIPVWFIKQLQRGFRTQLISHDQSYKAGAGPPHLVVFLHLLVGHRTQIVPRKCAQQKVALQGATLARLVHEPRAQGLDRLIRSRYGRHPLLVFWCGRGCYVFWGMGERPRI
jgi:hypothetical protein